jgi:hypothetical protein
MKFSDEEIIAALEGFGAPWREHFVLDGDSIVYFNSSGRLFVNVIENDDLYAAAKRFLSRHGLEHVEAPQWHGAKHV